MVDEDKSIAELLQDIKAVRDANWDNPTRAIPPLAALLVKLSRQASETADKNILVSKWMLVVTGVILTISIVQLAVSCKPQAVSAPTAIPAQPTQSDPKPANQDAPKNERRQDERAPQEARSGLIPAIWRDSARSGEALTHPRQVSGIVAQHFRSKPSRYGVGRWRRSLVGQGQSDLYRRRRRRHYPAVARGRRRRTHCR